MSNYTTALYYYYDFRHIIRVIPGLTYLKSSPLSRNVEKEQR